MVALLLVTVAVSLFLPNVKLDLTANKIHTLSPATVSMVRNLKDLVKIKVYLSEDVPPEIKPLADNLKTVLSEISSLNKSKLQVSYADPNKDSAAKEEALRYGITPLQFSSVKSDKLEVANGYFGLVLVYGNKQVVLSVAGDVGNLEYFLVSGIKKLTEKQLPTILLATGNGDVSTDEMQVFSNYADSNYQLETVDLSKEKALDNKNGILIIDGPTSTFNQAAQDQIKQWVEAKKGVLFLVNSASVNSNLEGQARPPMGIESLLKSQGIELVPKLILDPSSAVASFSTKSGGFYTQYLYWLQIRPENINQSLPPLSGLQSMLMPWTSPLIVDGKAKAMVYSSPDAWTVTDLSNLSPLAKVVQGSDVSKKVVAAINTDTSRIAVIGNSDLIKDQFVSSDQQNLVMVFNLIDYLSQDDSLLSIRAKVISNPPLKNISDTMKQVVRYGDIGLPVVLLLLIGGVSYFVRKKRISAFYD